MRLLTRKKLYSSGAAVLSGMLLLGCGGGSTVDTSFPLSNAVRNIDTNSAAHTLNIDGNGQRNGGFYTVTGSATLLEGAGNQYVSFNGRTAWLNRTTMAGTLFENYSGYPINSIVDRYVADDGTPLGVINNDNYCNVNSYAPLPYRIRMGESYTYAVYDCADRLTLRPTGQLTTTFALNSGSSLLLADLARIDTFQSNNYGYPTVVTTHFSLYLTGNPTFISMSIHRNGPGYSEQLNYHL